MTVIRLDIRQLAVAAVLVSLAVIGAGCGETSSGPGGDDAPAGGSAADADVERARARIEQHSQRVTSFSPPGSPIDGIERLRGKTIWYVPIYRPAALFESTANAFRAALGEVGMRMQVCDGKANPSDVSACITQAVQARAAGIVTDAISFELAPQAYRSAAAKKVPVLALDTDEPVPASFGDSVRTMTIHVDEQARLAADAIIADSEAESNVLFLELTDSEHTRFAAGEGTKPEFRDHCQRCEVTAVTSTAPEVQKVPSLIGTALIKNPNIDYVLSQFDATAPAVLQGMGQVGRKSQLKFVSTTAELAGMQRVKSGQQLADVGNDLSMQMWNATDALMRMNLGAEPAKRYTLPIRVFYKDDVEDLTLTPEALERGEWYSDGSFRDMYRKLWGTG